MGPSTQWLGFTIDLEHGQVSIPDKKLTNLWRLLKDACMQVLDT